MELDAVGVSLANLGVAHNPLAIDSLMNLYVIGQSTLD